MREIAEALGVSKSYASSLYNDPDRTGERARKDSYSLPCPECGRPMSGANGRNVAPKRCLVCEQADSSSRRWTRETIIEVFQEFHRLTGRTPSPNDAHGLAPSLRMSETRRAEIAAAIVLVRLPSPQTVAAVFGGWPLAVDAAGLPRTSTGNPGHREPRRAPFSWQQESVIQHLRVHGEAVVTDFPFDAKSSLIGLVRRGLVERQPPPGRKTPLIYRLREDGDMTESNQWVVLRPKRDKSGAIVGADVVKQVAAPTREIAAERAATEPGDYVAVQARHWNDILPLGVVEKLAVVR